MNLLKLIGIFALCTACNNSSNVNESSNSEDTNLNTRQENNELLASNATVNNTTDSLSTEKILGSWKGMFEFKGGYKHEFHIMFRADKSYVSNDKITRSNAGKFEDVGTFNILNDTLIQLYGTTMAYSYLSITQNGQIQFLDQNKTIPSNLVSCSIIKSKAIPSINKQCIFEIIKMNDKEIFIPAKNEKYAIAKEYNAQIITKLALKKSVMAIGFIAPELYDGQNSRQEFHLISIQL